jgi:hypothetical protein
MSSSIGAPSASTCFSQSFVGAHILNYQLGKITPARFVDGLDVVGELSVTRPADRVKPFGPELLVDPAAKLRLEGPADDALETEFAGHLVVRLGERMRRSGDQEECRSQCQSFNHFVETSKLRLKEYSVERRAMSQATHRLEIEARECERNRDVCRELRRCPTLRRT